MDHSELSCTLAPGPGWAYVCCWLWGGAGCDGQGVRGAGAAASLVFLALRMS